MGGWCLPTCSKPVPAVTLLQYVTIDATHAPYKWPPKGPPQSANLEPPLTPITTSTQHNQSTILRNCTGQVHLHYPTLSTDHMLHKSSQAAARFSKS